MIEMARDEGSQAAPLINGRHREQLAKRGLSVEAAQLAGLRSMSAAEATEILGFNPKSGGIAFPYVHPITKQTRSWRFRPDTPLMIDGKEAKYLSPKGTGNLVYFPPCIEDRLKNVSEPLYIAEGEFKALSAWQAGLLCIGIIGVWGWLGKDAAAESRTIADFGLIPLKGRAVTIIFDSDVALNYQVRRARHALGKEIYRRGASAVYGLDLPALHGVKVGLDDFLAGNALDALLDLDIHELPPTDLPPFSDAISVLLRDPDEPLEWGIENILPIGASGWRIAAPKVGKSWDMLHEVYSLSTAQPLYGRFRVPQRRKVLFIEEEDPRRRIKRRLRRIIHAHHGIEPDDTFLRYAIKKGFRLDDPAWQEVLEWEIKSFYPDFVYLDVFTRLHAKNINDPEEMGKIVLFLDRLSRDYRCAFIILHHTRKSNAGQDDHDEIMGSRVLGGFAEGSLFFYKTKEKGVVRVRVSLKDEPEDGSFEAEFLIRLEDTEDGQGIGFKYLGPPTETMASQKTREAVMAAVLASEKSMSAKEVAEVVGCSKPTASDHLNVLADLGMVIKIPGSTHRFAKPQRVEK